MQNYKFSYNLRLLTWSKLGLELDQKIFTMMNLIFWTWPELTTSTNIKWCQKYLLVRSACRGPQPRLARSHWQGHLPSLASPVASLLYKKKTSGTDIRKTQDVKLRFIVFNRFVGFNFGQIQLLRFIVVMVWSYSFGHLDTVKWITLYNMPTNVALIE